MSPYDDIMSMSPNGNNRVLSALVTMFARTPADLGLVIRERRRALGLDQATLAERVGVSRQWVVEIERGKPRAELALVMKTLEELGLRVRVDDGADKATDDVAAPPDIDAIVQAHRGSRR